VPKAGEEAPDGGAREQLASPSWLLLTHSLPAEPAYLRVKVSRRLERLGAVALKNSVYVLPPTEEALEDFQWLSREITENGGETSLCRATFVDGTSARLIADFRRARAADYERLIEAAVQLRQELEETMEDRMRGQTRARINRLQEQLSTIESIDFFAAPGATEARQSVDGLEAMLRDIASWEDDGGACAPAPGDHIWVTRRGVKVDRIFSAWLIRRFIDPAARFKFVSVDGYEPAAGELRFDMFDGEYTHTAETCTFETLLRRFDLDDPALRALGEIVHDIDCKDDKFGRPEVAGVASLIDGITAAWSDDPERIRHSREALNGLYEHFRTRP